MYNIFSFYIVMNTSYIIQLLLSFISFGILISVYQYLGDLKNCACFLENEHPKYKINIQLLQVYEILEIIALFIFIGFITMYKSKLFKGGGKQGMKFFVLLSSLVFLFISGYVSYYSILLFLMAKEDCLCVDKWQKYIVYIQGVFNSVYFLRILFSMVIVFLFITFNN